MRTVGICAIAFLVILTSTAAADTAVFETGDRLQGELVELAGERIVFRSSVAGRVTVARRKLEDLSLAGGERQWTLVTADGEVRRGSVRRLTNDYLVFKPEHGAALKLRRSRIGRLSSEDLPGASRMDAGRVYLENGDRLTGHISLLKEGKLTLEMAGGEKVTVELSRVSTFSTSREANLYTRSGGLTRTRVRAAGPGRIWIPGGPLPGGNIMRVSELLSVNQPPHKEPRWTGSLTGGYTASSGNTRTESSVLKLRLKKRWTDTRVKLRGRYSRVAQSSRDTEEEILTEQELDAEGQYDHFFTERFYSYGSVRYRRDRVSSLDTRILGSGGAGYQWAETDRLTFSTEAGAGLNYEDYSGPSGNTTQGSAELTYELEAALNHRLTILHDFTMSPSLGQLSDYYATATAELRASLTESIYSSVQVDLEYDSEPGADTSQTDATYTVGGGVEF